MMPFDDSVITDIRPPVYRPELGGVLLQWSSSAPAGTIYQVYVARRLVWHGKAKRCVVPPPAAKSRIDIGAVDRDERQINFASTLPANYDDRAELAWIGGTFLDPTGEDTVVGFNVYASAAAGEGVDYDTRIASVPVYAVGAFSDGYGLGGYGLGGWGRSAASYAWTSGPLTNGIWTFAILPVDRAGNESAGSEIPITIESPPRAPAVRSDGTRLASTYSVPDTTLTLDWDHSPDWAAL